MLCKVLEVWPRNVPYEQAGPPVKSWSAYIICGPQKQSPTCGYVLDRVAKRLILSREPNWRLMQVVYI